MARLVVFLASLLMSSVMSATALGRVPDIEDLLGIETVGEAQISPDGNWVAYTVTAADFEEDAYVSQIWLVDASAGSGQVAPFVLTRGAKGGSDPKWSPDGRWLGFLSSRHEDEAQIFAIRPGGGEAIRLTHVDGGVTDFAWSRDGKTIAYTAADADDAVESREKHMGAWHVVRREYRHRHLWTFDVLEAMRAPTAGSRRTNGEDFSVRDFSFSPDGTKIAFSATVNPDLVQGGTGDIYVVTLADNAVEKLVSQSGPDTSPVWSPDGDRVAFSTYLGREPYYALNNELAVVATSGGEPKVLTASFDEEPRLVTWNRDGIYFEAFDKTSRHLYRIDEASASIDRITEPDEVIASAFSLSEDGKRAAFIAATPTTLQEVQVSPVSPFEPRTLTDMTGQLKDLEIGTREVISWRSEDGATIEGILIKPADFDPARKYPLLCVIHGGPTGIDPPYFRETRTYPVDAWVGRGAVVLKVNYRGSAGYGEGFRTLNVRNLGVGDAWDVLSGIDHLIEQGFVDPERLGCMGWSQGGYISAFLTTSTDRFAAISVGAGISNWATYYYNTDITPFTIQYLGDDPADDRAIYEKTSPMTYIHDASTPTLIQHGENDRRVPIPNAYELRQGLEDRGVPVEMIVYEGFGHGVNKPRAQRAVMWHNLVWFNHYLWGDPLPPLDAPELPPEKGDEKKTDTH